MKASELIKILQEGIEKYGDAPVFMLDDYSHVRMVTYQHNEIDPEQWGGNRFELDWSANDWLELQYYDADAEPDIKPGHEYLAG